MKDIILTALTALTVFIVVLTIGTALDFVYAYLYTAKPNGNGFVLGIIVGIVLGIVAGKYVYEDVL